MCCQEKHNTNDCNTQLKIIPSENLALRYDDDDDDDDDNDDIRL